MTYFWLRALRFALAQLAVLVCVAGALAANDFWAAANSDYFETDSRWDDGSRPTDSDSATFDQPGTYAVFFDETTFSVYGGEPTINDLFLTAGTVTFYTVSGPTRTLSMNGTGGAHDIDISAGTMTLGTSVGPINMETESLLFVDDSATLNVRFGSQLDIGLLSIIRTGSTVNVASTGKFYSPGGINMGTDGNGTLTVDGAGSLVETNGLSLWGGGGGAANATFSNSSVGTFADGLLLVSNAGPGSSATMNVQTSADVTVAGEFALGQYGGAGNVATLNVYGSGSTVGHTGTNPLIVGHSSTGTATINIGVTSSGGLLTADEGLTINRTGTVNIGTGANTATLLANGNITINGGVLQRGTSGSLTLLPGTAVTIQNGGRATFTGSFTTTNNVYNVTGTNSKLEVTSFLQIGNGATVNVTSAGLATAPSYIDIGTAGNGTLTASGTSSQVSGGNTTSYWGDSGGTANVTLSNSALATFSTGIEMARSATAGTTATVDVLSGADLNIGLLRLATNGGATTSATLNVQGSGSTVTQGGTTLNVGHSATGTAAINIGTTTSGAVFTTNSTTATINKTGTVTIGGASTSGTFNVNGNISIIGGVLQRNAAGIFTLATGRSLSVTNGGRATFVGSYTTANANYSVLGPGSKIEVTNSFLQIDNGATVSVHLAGRLDVSSWIDIGNSGNGTLTVDGSGSAATGTGQHWWGGNGYTANVTLSNDAFGSFGSIRMARTAIAGTAAQVNVLSGADMFLDSLNIADSSGVAISGTLNVQGSGSSVTQSGTSTLTMGSSTGTATINIGTTSSGATFTTGSGQVTINRLGTVNVGGASSTGLFNLVGNASVNGIVRVNAGSNVNISAGKSMTLTSGGTLDNSGTLEGNGTVNGTVLNGGVVEPGTSVGTLTINGNYTQQFSGTVILEIASLASFDRLLVSQHAALSGQILISLLGGFVPAAGASLDLIDWNTVSGAFTVFQYPGLPSGLDWDFSQVAITGVVLVVSTLLAGDYNADGTVDAADYVVWRKYSGTMTTLPNDPHGGTIGALQFNTWRANFGNMSGSGTSAAADSSDTAVPEPGSFSLLLLTIVGVLAVSRGRVAAKNRC